MCVFPQKTAKAKSLGCFHFFFCTFSSGNINKIPKQLFNANNFGLFGADDRT